MKIKVWFPLVLALFCTTTLSFAADGYSVGSMAKDFRLKNIDGKMLSMKDFPASKGFLVIFTCNHCPYSKAYEDRIIALHKNFAPKGFPVIAINPNDPVASPEDSFDKMQVRAKEKQFPFPYLFDDTQEITKLYGATRTPHVFMIQKKADQYEVVYIGAIDDNDKDEKAVKEKYVENAIAAVLDGKTPAVTFTKAIGCTIKWKKKTVKS